MREVEVWPAHNAANAKTKPTARTSLCISPS
jgi:hypothetical protein